MKSGRSSRGFTLLETLVAVVLIGIVALAAVPLLSSQNPTKLDVAAAEVGNALRFALGEVERLGGGCVWVDGSIVPGHLRVYSSATCSSSSSGWVVVTDPLTKRALDVEKLMINPGMLMQVYNDSFLLLGPLQPGSGVVLTLGPQTATVALNEITGLVTLP